jgi:hypothetical protein
LRVAAFGYARKIGYDESDDTDGGDEAARHCSCVRWLRHAGERISRGGGRRNMRGNKKGRGTQKAGVQRPYGRMRVGDSFAI